MRDQSLMFKAWNNEHAQNIAPGLSCKKILRSKWDNSYLKKECQPTIIGVFTASGDFLPMLTYFILLICLESQYSFIRNFVKCSFIQPRFFFFFLVFLEIGLLVELFHNTLKTKKNVLTLEYFMGWKNVYSKTQDIE